MELGHYESTFNSEANTDHRGNCGGNSNQRGVENDRVSKVTILKLLKDVGEACAKFEKRLWNPTCKQIQSYENLVLLPREGKYVPPKTSRARSVSAMFGRGRLWTQIRSFCGEVDDNCRNIQRNDRKFIHARSSIWARQSRATDQDTATGHISEAVEGAFGVDVDYAMLVELYF